MLRGLLALGVAFAAELASSRIYVSSRALRHVEQLLHPSVERDFDYVELFNGFSLSSASDRVRKSLSSIRGIRVSVDSQMIPSSLLAQEYAPPHLARLQLDRPVGPDRGPYVYRYESRFQGRSQTINVMDSGIDNSHSALYGRIRYMRAYGDRDTDPHGHGTAVAGLIIGHRYSVAKEARIVSRTNWVNGVPTIDATLQCLRALRQLAASPTFCGDNWARRQHSVIITANAPWNDALDVAIQHVVTIFGIIVVASAGHGAADACQFTPSGSPPVITVGGIDQNDNFWLDGGHGPCVDVLAPAQALRSTGSHRLHLEPGSSIQDVEVLVDGTSFAAALSVGMAAAWADILQHSLLRERRPDYVRFLILSTAQAGAIRFVPPSTPNLVLKYVPGQIPG
ncbi:hypothetical protein PYCC9005_003300 [Savitreella phatthalungensis]